MSHVKTVDRFLFIEVGYASDMGPAGLSDAIIEALAKAGVLAEANITYLKTTAPGENLGAVDLFLPEPADITPPPIPSSEDEPPEDLVQPNV